MRMMPAIFEFADAAPLDEAQASARAAEIFPRDFGAPPPAAQRLAWSGARRRALAAALVAHACLLAGILAWRQSGGQESLGEEIPIEIVVDTPAADTASPPEQAAQSPAPEMKAEEPSAEPPARERSAPETAKSESPVEEAGPPPAAETPAVAILAPPQALPAEPDAAFVAQEKARRDAERRAEDIARKKREEIARQRQAAREEAERERRDEARRAAAQEKREQEKRERAAQERRRVAALAPSRGAGLSQGDAFDAASYRQIVARAVSAAVSRACPSGGGGRVVVALTIGASGHIAGVSLSSGSGNGALDAAALGAVRRSGPFPAPTGRSSVSVPVAVTCR